MKRIEFSLQTKGFTDIIDITDKIINLFNKIKQKENFSLVNIFVVGSTASIATIENEPNLYEDFKEALEQIIPVNKNYKHHMTWGDDNGSSHIRASLIGPEITVPIDDQGLLLGTWQKIVLIDFDTRPRERKVVCTFI